MQADRDVRDLNPSVDSGRAMRILLVDDEPFNLELLQQELEGFGFDLRTAANGQEALDQIEAEPPDMLFLDLMMPVMDGFNVLERLQAHEQWRTIPVVIISASDDLANIVRGIELGAVDFLPKPFEPAILHARLTSGLEKKRLRDLEQQHLRALERELEIGREIQADFLPDRIPQPAGWRVQAHFEAAREVAGDFYDVFELGPGQLGLLLGDVTDKGVGSALYMALYRSLLRAGMMVDQLTGDRIEPVCESPEDCLLRAVSLVNHYICKMHSSAMLATVFLGVLETDSGILRFVNAGHDPPIHLAGDAVRTEIAPTGPILGAIEGASFQVEHLQLRPGGSLVLYSDGVPDAQDAQGRMYGADRLRQLLDPDSGADSDPFEAILADLEAHTAGADQYDDISLLVVSRMQGREG